ncbi:MAG TPA: type VI secretion system-associated FHA domain protein [Candidatus Angelobacter sp.]|jgi:hypothetical protein|nr:type VI secretion system-associated FHA domain protein [Candidatus Angelobacter sp.]
MIHSNTSLTEEESEWINSCAGRLRLIQADAATTAADKRRDYLKEEIARSFADVAPANRKRLLGALLARFPISGHVLQNATPPSAPAPAKAVPETVDQILERLLAATAQFPPEKRSEISKRLSESGLAPAGNDAAVVEISEDLRKRLGLKSGQQPQMTKVVELAVFLVEAIGMLDQNALRTMRELSPRSPVLSRAEDFRSTASRYLTGGEASIEAQWTAIRSLLGSLLAAIQGGGKDFGRQMVDRMSPNAIEDVIVSEGGKLFGPNKKERCWDRYKDLFEDMSTPDLIDRKIKECLAAFVERTVHGNR